MRLLSGERDRGEGQEGCDDGRRSNADGSGKIPRRLRSGSRGGLHCVLQAEIQLLIRTISKKLLAGGDDQVNESGTTVPGETSHWGEKPGWNDLSCGDISGDDCEGQHRALGTRRIIRRGHQSEHAAEHGVGDAMLWRGRSESDRIARRTGLLRCR
jgi:hypothetical protein